MATILAAIGSKVLISLLSALGGWLLHLFQTYRKDQADQAADEAKTAAAQKALKDAKTKEEIDNAAKGIADGF